MFKKIISDLAYNAKTYFKNKTVSFYIGFAVAVLSVCVSVYFAVVCPASIGFNAGVFLLILFGGLSYPVVSLFGKINIAAFVLSVCDFFGMIVFIRVYYTVILENDFMSGGFSLTPNMTNFIVIAVLLLVITVTANVLCWKKNKLEIKEEAANDAQA
ncbi:MAG TPA: hypothetical protein DDY77_03130 [Clostridiales bacterium]|nr:hypothetical protein [Clostridiales bacterium]